ncbi:MAG: hypothetical protein HFG83_13875 [Dorea sp.]|nr:hypothetical protein [Dorea sp.]
MSTVRYLLYRELWMVEYSKSGLAGMDFRGRAEVSVFWMAVSEPERVLR